MTENVLPPHWPPAPPGRPEPAARRQYITRLMGANLWRRGESAGVLSEHWGLAEGTVENDASEASAAIRAALPDAESALAVVLGLAQTASEDAARCPEPRDAGRLRLGAAKLIADVIGVAAPKKVEVHATGGGADTDAPWFKKSEGG